MGVLYLYNITWRGLACVAYPYLGAMRRPEHRDRRGGINSHVFFYFLNFSNLYLQGGRLELSLKDEK
jgi:hypothetical protein